MTDEKIKLDKKVKMLYNVVREKALKGYKPPYGGYIYKEKSL